jgi:hypothetical protein
MVIRQILTRLAMAGALAVGGLCIASATPALASASTCENVFFPNYYLCENLSGAGLYINYLHAAATYQETGSVSIHIEIWGPSGTIKNCSEITIKDNQTATCQWTPQNNKPAGSYGFTVWRKLSNGWGDDGDISVYVHS